MRNIAAVLAVVVLVLAGCTDQPVGSADCNTQIRVDDVVYTSYGFTREPATEHRPAEVAACHDVGPDPEGSVFTDDGATVTSWRFDGYSADEVLGVRQDRHRYVVLVATSVSDTDRDRIMAALG